MHRQCQPPPVAPALVPYVVGPIIVDPVELDMPDSDELMLRVFEQIEAIPPD